jgi:hypothetical protein
MFEEFGNINFSKVSLDVSEIELDIDVSGLDEDIMSILRSYNASIIFCEEEDSDITLSLDSWDSTVDPQSKDQYTVAEVNVRFYDADNNVEDDFSFEFTYPRIMTYEELIYAYQLLLGNIFSMIQNAGE